MHDRLLASASTFYAIRADTRGLMPQTTESTLMPGAQRPPVGGAIRRPVNVMFPAERALRRHGFVPYVATESWSRRRNRFTKMRVTTTRALIPGLVLIEHEPGTPELNWYRLMEVPFVRGVFGMVQNLSGHDVARLRAMSDGLWASPEDPWLLKAGDRAEVLEGPFIGCTATIEGVQLDDVPEPIARGLVDVFGRATPVAFRLQDLKGVPAE